jgi:hypothetical protein
MTYSQGEIRYENVELCPISSGTYMAHFVQKVYDESAKYIGLDTTLIRYRGAIGRVTSTNPKTTTIQYDLDKGLRPSRQTFPTNKVTSVDAG